jgi:predicted nucleic acid-binding protein
MLVIDSNIFVSALDPVDRFHTECKPLFDRVIRFEVEAVCPASVLVEVTSVLRRRMGSAEIARYVWRNLRKLPSVHWLEMSLEVAERMCEIVSRTGLRAGDAAVLQVAVDLGVPLVTKDREFWEKRLAGVLLFEPAELER